jgi:hypothetical protein
MRSVSTKMRLSNAAGVTNPGRTDGPVDLPQQGLIWDRLHGSPYGVDEMIAKELRDDGELDKYAHLFDHTKRFKSRGSGRKKPILAISSPYRRNENLLRGDIADFAARFGLNTRVNNDRNSTYTVEGTLPVLFWRPDLHNLR